ncbi:YggS family pyridoxal phosphate-dependent enzyme [Antrihabitans cavernicola]|uniref:Pyridoxal phosphate homeostasis protein n=1 Tax=Antrihabitans cavernicola TaxID=2495913 RepID=A0A5A7SF37_9NOCA|nr:YggS family pyridoxal phosphate-dependent enzyme [Spelaeibacter cavernicola]KAA0023145.1 YggS family pyridoxal phosphate-dependent enzyme [Spelaeibacter cavernicola]
MTETRDAELAASLQQLVERLDAACRAARRDPADVALLPVTKFFPASDVEILYALGRREFGESREQEASAKVADLAASVADDPIRWHMIGHLQRNKAKSVAAWAYAIHSVDSARLVSALDRAVTAEVDAGTRTEPLRVLLQVSLDGDPDRGGVVGADLLPLADRVAAAVDLELRGVMAIPPLGADPGRAFAELAQLHSALTAEHPGAIELSAGMSGDLELAVEHGSTCVRVGTALLGSRPITSS